MRRRDFVTLLGGAAATSPVAAVAQLPGEMRRVALLIPYPPTDPDIQDWMRALRDELARLGWVRGWNLEFDERWTGDNMDLIRSHSANIVELKPNVRAVVGLFQSCWD